ncbi:hypothetical protein MVEN_01235300 [Mycena venus]|uniref:F-box domain-containing protein n=1 Tax=Mycena venus TaxID=2733690 RepID=A0A8H6Y5B3_9AGAR|nr:hypothetical protein MVEN_01235300 [Mycena venus]
MPVISQELVDECLSHIVDPVNLRACALVCRSWADTAQRALFTTISVSSVTSRKRLEYALRASPHLVHYIQSLMLRQDIQMVEAICNLPFTHLQNVSVHHSGPLSIQSVVPLQTLFSLPSLRRVELDCYFFAATAFIQIWNLCTNIRHLRLRCVNHSGNSFQPTQRDSLASIALESLKLGHVKSIETWLNHDLCPFDLSRLTLLSVDVYTSLFAWPRMAPALQTIETLDFTIDHKIDTDPEVIDLSLFPSLMCLRMKINMHHITQALDTLSTVTSASRIRQIIFRLRFRSSVACQQLDSKVASLPLQHPLTVGFEGHVEESHFPQLTSRNMLRRTVWSPFASQLL